jgi:hypothetical protein
MHLVVVRVVLQPMITHRRSGFPGTFGIAVCPDRSGPSEHPDS